MSTPGQVAYEAYAAVLHDTVLLEPWRRLLWLDRRAWEAAAQAVLEAFVASARPLGAGGSAMLSPFALQVEPGLTPLLALATEAIPFLRDAFGAVLRDIEARISRDEAGELGVRVVARVASHDVPYLEGLLHIFDETWWLANSHRGDSRLVFDYETTAADDTP